MARVSYDGVMTASRQSGGPHRAHGESVGTARVDRRRPKLDGVAVLTVRVDLVRAVPPIWRRLEMRSDLSLADVHRILQIAFDWYDCHLYRFALGEHPFDAHAQLFLCPFEVEEREDDGLPVEQVRLDEVLQEPGDRLAYVYDYGDDWHLRIKVEAVRPDSGDAPLARATGGRRAAPPEDCGSLRTADELASVLPDPAHFDLDELNDLLLFDGGMPLPDTPGDAVLRDLLRPFLWFLHEADEGGIPLTSAGYMAPVLVREASGVVPDARDLLGTKNREVRAYPVLAFREMLQSLKLLRKYKGRLLATRRGTGFRTDVSGLWEWIAQSLVPDIGGFEHEATLTLLERVARGRGDSACGVDELHAVASEMTRQGWRENDGPVSGFAVRDLAACTVLRNLAAVETSQATGVRLEDGREPDPAVLMAVTALRTAAAPW